MPNVFLDEDQLDEIYAWATAAREAGDRNAAGIHAALAARAEDIAEICAPEDPDDDFGGFKEFLEHLAGSGTQEEFTP